MATETCSDVARLLTQLKRFSGACVFNPWKEVDSAHDAGDRAPRIRSQNLVRYLSERVSRASVVLIAEAAGYQGCKFSGIAMTSERQLMSAEGVGSEYFEGEKQRTSRVEGKPNGFTESTATVVWTAMLEAGLRGRDWVNWNTFAWHPHKPGKPLSNRPPTPAELGAGLPVLERFLALFPKVPVVAVGNEAEKGLELLGVELVAKVRHPSYGGATKFRAEIAAELRKLPKREGVEGLSR